MSNNKPPHSQAQFQLPPDFANHQEYHPNQESTSPSQFNNQYPAQQSFPQQLPQQQPTQEMQQQLLQQIFFQQQQMGAPQQPMAQAMGQPFVLAPQQQDEASPAQMNQFQQMMQNDSQFSNSLNMGIQSIAQVIEQRMGGDASQQQQQPEGTFSPGAAALQGGNFQFQLQPQVQQQPPSQLGQMQLSSAPQFFPSGYVPPSGPGFQMNPEASPQQPSSPPKLASNNNIKVNPASSPVFIPQQQATEDTPSAAEDGGTTSSKQQEKKSLEISAPTQPYMPSPVEQQVDPSPYPNSSIKASSSHSEEENKVGSPEHPPAHKSLVQGAKTSGDFLNVDRQVSAPIVPYESKQQNLLAEADLPHRGEVNPIQPPKDLSQNFSNAENSSLNFSPLPRHHDSGQQQQMNNFFQGPFGQQQNQFPNMPGYIMQFDMQQLRQIEQLNYFKENVPCIEYLYGFCFEGDRDCMFKHPKSAEGQLPQYGQNECLPKEYLDKVQNFFDDSSITNFSIIQNFLIKQVRQQIQGQYGRDPFGGDMGHSVNKGFKGQAAPESFDLQSLLGIGGLLAGNSSKGYGGKNDSMYGDSYKKSQYRGGGRDNGSARYDPSQSDYSEKNFNRAPKGFDRQQFNFHPVHGGPIGQNPKMFEEINKEIESTKKVFPGTTRFFIIKSHSFENLETSLRYGAWATTQGPSRKLTHALRNVDNVILIFSVNESSSFQGMARMESEPDPNFRPNLFRQDKSLYANKSQSFITQTHQQQNLTLMPNFKVQWLMKCHYPFRELDHLPSNPMNDNQPIQKSFNGSELPARLGNYLCHLLLHKGISKPSLKYQDKFMPEEEKKQPTKKKKGQRKNQQEKPKEDPQASSLELAKLIKENPQDFTFEYDRHSDKQSIASSRHSRDTDPYQRLIFRDVSKLEEVNWQLQDFSQQQPSQYQGYQQQQYDNNYDYGQQKQYGRQQYRQSNYYPQQQQQYYGGGGGGHHYARK